jgi:hypothetical protein
MELNEKMNYLPTDMPFLGEQEQQVQYFEEELEINDFPQQLRFRICSRVHFEPKNNEFFKIIY